jgi:hypothetical protein
LSTAKARDFTRHGPNTWDHARNYAYMGLARTRDPGGSEGRFDPSAVDPAAASLMKKGSIAAKQQTQICVYGSL